VEGERVEFDSATDDSGRQKAVNVKSLGLPYSKRPGKGVSKLQWAFQNAEKFLSGAGGQVHMASAPYYWSVDTSSGPGEVTLQCSDGGYLQPAASSSNQLCVAEAPFAWSHHEQMLVHQGKAIDVWERGGDMAVLYAVQPQGNRANQVWLMQPAAKNRTRLRVFSWNIRVDNAPSNHQQIIAYLTKAHHDYDVIALQEVPGHDFYLCLSSSIGHEFVFVREHGEILAVRKGLHPVFHVLQSADMKTTGAFKDVEQRQRMGRPFLFAALLSVGLVIGTCHAWSVFAELSGNYNSLTEKMLYITQAFTAMHVAFPDVALRLAVGDFNLMEDGADMRAQEQQALAAAGILDAAAAQPVVTWDGVANSKQIKHRERHRPDRLLANSKMDMSVLVEQSALSDHYPIICNVILG
jgi:hypothetical protein